MNQQNLYTSCFHQIIQGKKDKKINAYGQGQTQQCETDIYSFGHFN